jgi:hypothetical protein
MNQIMGGGGLYTAPFYPGKYFSQTDFEISPSKMQDRRNIFAFYFEQNSDKVKRERV